MVSVGSLRHNHRLIVNISYLSFKLGLSLGLVLQEITEYDTLLTCNHLTPYYPIPVEAITHQSWNQLLYICRQPAITQYTKI